MKTNRELWEAYRRDLCTIEPLGMQLDLSRMDLDAAWLAGMAGAVAAAHDEMERVERGERVNTDEDRMVGHYWLRDPARAPTPELREEIESTVAHIRRFAGDVHRGRLLGAGKEPLTDLVVIGIGGSALGPQLVADALGGAHDRLIPHFVDNTDPDGIDRVFGRLAGRLGRTLVVVISKSGGTKETRNGMLEAEAAFRAAGLDFAQHAVAVTGEGSELDQHAVRHGWITRFPMWDWVGGRTSELSAVGLLPAALQGLDVGGLLDGARQMDEVTRARPPAGQPLANPALGLALAWFHEGGGRGMKDMVILPYKDRLMLMSRYLQQLVMESLGKERDRRGEVVHQGIAVYGNKGSTDQHAYVQQLREGVPNFFVTFIEVLRDRGGASLAVEPDVTAGDYLAGFLLGTRRALYENGRRSITLTVPEVSPRVVGALIALYERAVGFYAAMVGINAYHQPGVEAGKKAAGAVIDLQRRALRLLRERAGAGLTAAEVADAIAAPDEVETVLHVLDHLAANPDHGVNRAAGDTPFTARYHT